MFVYAQLGIESHIGYPFPSQPHGTDLKDLFNYNYLKLSANYCQ